MPDLNARPTDHIIPPVLAGCLAILVAASLDAVMHGHAKGGPELGDLIDFAAVAPDATQAGQLSVQRADGRDCLLDIATLRRSGGSLITEQRMVDGTLTIRMHWAGGPTASGQDDCGSRADLLLGKSDVTALLYAAGGYGPRSAHATRYEIGAPQGPVPIVRLYAEKDEGGGNAGENIPPALSRQGSGRPTRAANPTLGPDSDPHRTMPCVRKGRLFPGVKREHRTTPWLTGAPSWGRTEDRRRRRKGMYSTALRNTQLLFTAFASCNSI